VPDSIYIYKSILPFHVLCCFFHYLFKADKSENIGDATNFLCKGPPSGKIPAMMTGPSCIIKLQEEVVTSPKMGKERAKIQSYIILMEVEASR
jgi:hypothetical protein